MADAPPVPPAAAVASSFIASHTATNDITLEPGSNAGSSTKDVNSSKSEPSIYDYHNIPGSRWERGYRSAMFNVVIIGLISFTQMGIWNALMGTGAGGAQEPYLVNGANALTFGIMVFGCSIMGVLANKYGIKLILILGTLGYAPYSASLYMNNRFGVEWFVLFGAALCGLSASSLWATEGAIAVGYPHTEDRAKATGVWLGLRQLGQIIGSAIQLGLNTANSQQGSVGYAVFLVFIALNCLGLPLALMISPPQKAIRRVAGGPWTVVSPKDSENASATRKSLLNEFKRLWKVVKLRHMLLLVPLLITFDMNRVYVGIYLARTFSVRSRALSGFISAISQALADIFWGWFLDLKFWGRRKRAQYSWAVFSVLMLASLSWLTVNEYAYSSTEERPALDWDQPGFARGFPVPTILSFLNEGHYIFCYYLIGSFHADVESVTVAVSVVRSFESVGSAVAYGIGATQVSPMTNLIVAFVAFALCIPPTAVATFLVPDAPKDYSEIVARSDTEQEDVQEAGKHA